MPSAMYHTSNGSARFARESEAPPVTATAETCEWL
eukprot:SAG22_NODE_20814_length_262_cov_0.950920_1_plen_35_part_01